MKKLIIILAFILLSVRTFAQSEATFNDGQISQVGVKQTITEPLKLRIQSNTQQPVVGVFNSRKSFDNYQTGVGLIADGLTVSLVGAGVTGIGVGIYANNNNSAVGSILTIGGGIMILAGEIMGIVGIYKMKHCSFDGGSITFSF